MDIIELEIDSIKQYKYNLNNFVIVQKIKEMEKNCKIYNYSIDSRIELIKNNLNKEYKYYKDAFVSKYNSAFYVSQINNDKVEYAIEYNYISAHLIIFKYNIKSQIDYQIILDMKNDMIFFEIYPELYDINNKNNKVYYILKQNKEDVIISILESLINNVFSNSK